jgi:hypothetical protein
MADSFAFLQTVRFDIGPPERPEQCVVSLQDIVGDGVQQLDFTTTFIWDNTLSQSVNLSNAKDQIIALVAPLGFVLTKPNMKINLQLN